MSRSGDHAVENGDLADIINGRDDRADRNDGGIAARQKADVAEHSTKPQRKILSIKTARQ